MYAPLKTVAGWMLPLLFLFIFGLAGCQSTESFYRGYRVENQSIAPLSTLETQQGAWKTFDIDLTYQYQKTDNILNISGTTTLGLYYELNTSRIRTLDLFLFFLDDESKVLETTYLVRRLEFNPEEKQTFVKSLNIPTEAASIAFGYKGTAQEDGSGTDSSDGGGGSQQIFFDLPKRPR
ncbi:MAG TPA: hypothetical protein VJ974_07960 [Geopsychrobacteraceae bacterium]|nr:hypothetical protein [Geopsychrobacteraceae bacterium]